MARVLIVDDEPHMRKILSVMLEADGHAVTEVGTVREALEALRGAPFDVVLTDQKLTDGDGFAVLAASSDIDTSMPVVILTAYASVELAVEAMRRGAFDFIAKPFSPGVVQAVVHRAVERASLLRENERLRGEVKRLSNETDIVGTSEAIRQLLDTVDRVAPTNATVLILGETGTGKELIARAIHKRSPRSAGAFIAVNCAAFPETLLDSELFGHEKGAFTGADRPRQGLFEAAHKGTLFLDEAGEMPPSLQAKLLRVLAEGQITRVGSTVARGVDVRVLAATHRDLRQRVRDGQFRDDLYYRLSVVPIYAPPLRNRLEDLPILVEHFLDQAARDLKIARKSLAPAALERLKKYEFPGNVRELRNLIERACILARSSQLQPSDFPGSDFESADASSDVVRAESGDLLETWIASLPEQIDLRATTDYVERVLVRRALDRAEGVQAEAARALGLSRSDIAYKLKKFGGGIEI